MRNLTRTTSVLILCLITISIFFFFIPIEWINAEKDLKLFYILPAITSIIWQYILEVLGPERKAFLLVIFFNIFIFLLSFFSTTPKEIIMNDVIVSLIWVWPIISVCFYQFFRYVLARKFGHKLEIVSIMTVFASVSKYSRYDVIFYALDVFIICIWYFCIFLYSR